MKRFVFYFSLRLMNLELFATPLGAHSFKFKDELRLVRKILENKCLQCPKLSNRFIIDLQVLCRPYVLV